MLWGCDLKDKARPLVKSWKKIKIGKKTMSFSFFLKSKFKEEKELQNEKQ